MRITVTHNGWPLLDLLLFERYEEPGERQPLGFAACELAEEPAG